MGVDDHGPLQSGAEVAAGQIKEIPMMIQAPRPKLPPVDPSIEACAIYQPGKPIEEVEREYGVTDVAKLASNENPLGYSPKAREAALLAHVVQHDHRADDFVVGVLERRHAEQAQRHHVQRLAQVYPERHVRQRRLRHRRDHAVGYIHFPNPVVAGICDLEIAGAIQYNSHDDAQRSQDIVDAAFAGLTALLRRGDGGGGTGGGTAG